MLKLNVVVDLAPLLNVKRYTDANRQVLLEVAADRYLKFLKKRHYGGANWVTLRPATIKRKRIRQLKYGTPANPNWVLRETDTLVDNLEKKATKNGYDVGHVVDRIHPSTPDRIGKNGKGRRIRISRLVRIHTAGDSSLPPRPVIEPPRPDTRKRMVADVRSAYDKVIRRYRKGK